MRVTRFFRVVSSVVLVAFTSLTLQPLWAAIQLGTRQERSAPAKAGDEKYGEVLAEVEEQSLKAKGNRGSGKPSKAEAKAIRALNKDLQALDAEVEAGFAATERHIRDKQLAQVIIDRHTAAVTLFRQKRDEFNALVKAVELADDDGADARIDAALASLTGFFDKNSQRRQRAPLDPNKLPWRTPKGDVRAPVESAAGFKSAKLAKSAPGTEDLAETLDVQLTPAIRAKAAELGGEPLAIYQWVRNNVDFFPTYGSVQGSDDTLARLRGNAFDTASLLIALLRVSNIPAHYAYGTIDVPVEQAMNWVGGVTHPSAAQQVLGQGGIPNRGLITGGKVTHIRMEHMWVEAWVDFVPSRGAKPRQGDSWVPMDPSFKQYTYSKGLDLRSQVAVDTTGFIDSAKQGATINEAEGWIQNLNPGQVQSRVDAYEAQLRAHVTAVNPAATVADVTGSQKIVAQVRQSFAGSLPYRLVVKGPTYAALPDNLRHKFRYSIYAGAFERAMDTPMWSFEMSLPMLAGKRLTIAFTPATAQDAALIASYLPKAPSSPSGYVPTDFPKTLTAYAKVNAQLQIDGVATLSGGPVSIGTELAARGGFTLHDLSGWDLTEDDSLLAGQQSELGLSIQGVSQRMIDGVTASMRDTESKLASGRFREVSAQQQGSDIRAAAIWGYFAEHDSQASHVKHLFDMVDRPSFSYGLFHNAAHPNKLFGIATTSITYTGALFDVGHLRALRWAKDNDAAKWVAYNRTRGNEASMLEHAVLETLFTNRATCRTSSDPPSSLPLCSEGISAVKAIALAQLSGQRVYLITPSNAAAVDQLALGFDTVNAIRNAVSAGKEVTVHQSRVTARGWTGAGYIVLDPATGAGGYLIEGGANGGNFSDDYWSRYLAWTNDHLIKTDPEWLIAALLLLLPALKAWFGFAPLMGSTNPYTTVIHGLAALLLQYTGISIPIAGLIGRVLWPIAFFIGIYNFTILVEGFFYAANGRSGPGHGVGRFGRSRHLETALA